MSERVIEVKNLYFAYNGEDGVLKDVSFSIDEGEFVAIIGPNGGGKSTLIRLIIGEFSPKRGEIRLLSKEPKFSREYVGYVPQNIKIDVNFPIKVIDVVMMGNLKRRAESKDLINRVLPFRYSQSEKSCVHYALERVGMEKYIYKDIAALSGGQRQRVMIARALCSNPKVLVLDEPTSSIDIDGQREIYNLLRELNREMTILVVSHDIATIGNYATKVIYINRESFIHNLKKNPINFPTSKSDEHFCQVELMQIWREKWK